MINTPSYNEYRGNICELCGTKAKPWPRTGKLRYRHKCSHGTWCVRGERLNGMHANHATCDRCLKHGRYVETTL